jgi:hypothetical protein
MPRITVGPESVATSHSVGIVFYEVAQDGWVALSHMPYTKYGRTSIRHPLESGEANESVMDTFRSCFHEVAKEDPNEFRYELLSKEPILIRFDACQDNPDGIHIKAFFAAKAISPLRDFILPDGDEFLGPISLIEVRELLRRTKGNTVPVHIQASRAALVALAGDKKVYDRYRDLIDSFVSPELTPEEEDMIARYPGKW